jgi:tetratricopeptide (TPR) repeat protein
MPSSNSVPNPYDFRSPVRNRQLLAGRAQTLEQVDSFLRQAAAGRPVHFSLFGPPGVGKSSLLNAVMATAAERRLLPIKLSLRQATCESEVAFYGAFFEAAFQKLLENGLIASDGELMASWLRQTRSGELVGPEHHPFEIALAIAADLNGKMVRHIQVPSLIRDISRILTLAENLRGIVLCVDAAEHLDASHDVADSLLELVDADPRIVLVTAAPQAGRLQAAASRSWAQIEVGPFETPQEVFEAITRPLESVDRSTFTLSPAAAEDIYTLTRGQPYEISLVCHFIWEAIQQQRQAEFELSDAVIERVLGEFIERGRHEASADIAHVAKLTTRDYELLAKLAPYEALTVKEIALTRLMPDDFQDDDIAEIEASIHADLLTLAQRGVLKVQDTRFALTVSDDARLYLRYAAERHTGERLDYGLTYAQQVRRVCREDFGRALAGEDSDAAHLIAVWRQDEIGVSRTGSLVGELRDAVAAGDIATLASVVQVPLDLSTFVANRDKGIIIYSFVLRVGLQEIEHATMVMNVTGLDSDELNARADEWLRDKDSFLTRYGIGVVELRCELLGAALADAVIAYAHIERFQSLVMSLYGVRQVKSAAQLFSSTIELAQALVGESPTDPLIRAKLGDAYNRLGFMLASDSQLQEALDAFARSEELDMEQHWVTVYNTAYVNARMERFEEAARLAQSAVDALGENEREMILHADLPTPAGWQHDVPWIAIVHVPAPWLERFLTLQTAVWRARADEQQIPGLEHELGQCVESVPLPVLRLAGWAELTVTRRHEHGLKLLDLAIDAAPLHEIELARRELARLTETADQPQVPTTPAQNTTIATTREGPAPA